MESLPAHDEDVVRRERRRQSPVLAGVVLCGGLSTRMGADKANIRIDGATLLERALRRLDDVCDPVLIAPGNATVATAGRQVMVDAAPEAGPLGGLVSALRASPHRLIAVVAVDLPWIDPRLIRMLAGRIGDRDVAVCETTRGVEPLHAVYSTSLLARAESALAGPRRSLRRLIAGCRAVRIAESDWRGAGISDAFTLNINTPEDLAELNQDCRR